MTLIVCPPPTAPHLEAEDIVPHPGFGETLLYRNGVLIWSSLYGEWWDTYETQPWTMGDLAEWCPVRQGVGWKLVVNGPFVREVYRFRKGDWVLTEKSLGFA